MYRRSQWAVPVLLGLAFLLAGCGPKKVTLSVELNDFKFTPSTLEVPSGAEVTLTLTNNATVIHQWVVMKLGAQAALPFDASDEPNVYFKAEVQPHSTQTVTFPAPSEAGEYQIICGLPGHAEAGMLGTLTVR